MFGVIAVFFAVSFLIGVRDSRRNDARERRKLAEAFGKPGAKQYPEGRLHELEGCVMRRASGDSFSVDEITWNDLDMDALFLSMDTTCSNAGEEYLYRLLKLPRTDGSVPVSEEGLLWWTENESGRIDVLRILQQLGRNSRYSLYDYLDLLSGVKERSAGKELYAVLLPAVSLGIMVVHPSAGILCLLLSFAFNIVTYFRVKREIDPYLYTFRYVVRLLHCGRKLAAEPFPHYEAEKEVMRSADRSLKGFLRGSGILLRGNGGISAANPADLLTDYLCFLFHIDLIKFDSMLRELRGKQQEVESLIGAVGAIDAEISIASWRKSLPFYCIPDLTGSRFEVTDLIHPLIREPVGNSIAVSSPVLLTGSNASGKSTFLKAAALAAVLSQSVHTAPAAAYRSRCYRIYTSMALRDDLAGGESYFIVEIRSLKRVLDAASEPSAVPVLSCIDEVLRGTNTTERISASTEILLQLAQLPMQVFAATHDLELTELLRDAYVNYHFTETVDGDDVKFSYKLLKGPADSRNAIRLLRAMGYDPAIADRAQERAEHYTKTGRWDLFERTTEQC